MKFSNITDLILKINEIESLLLNINQDNLDEVQEILISSNFVSSKDYYYVLLFSLNFIMQSRPHKLDLYKEILITLKKDMSEKNFFSNETELIRIFLFNEIALFHIGIDKNAEYIMKIDHLSSIYKTPFYYNPRNVSNDSYAKFIREDDIENFLILISRTNKDLRSYVNCPSLNPMGYFHHINLNQIEFISYSAFYGSIRIFKFLWMKLNSINKNEMQKEEEENENENTNELPNSLAICAIAGGNYEIIHILEEIIKKDKFSLISAIRFFQFELIDYLIETLEFEVGINELLTSIQCHNFNFFLEYCQKKCAKNDEDEMTKIVLFSGDFSNTVVLNYIRDVLLFDITRPTTKSNILIESVLKENINVLRFIFFENVFSLNYENNIHHQKRPLFDVNRILSDFSSFDGLAILHLVSSHQLFNVANFFLSDEFRHENHISIDLNVRDCTGATPLHWSVLFQNFEMFSLLISYSNASTRKNKQLQKDCIDVNAVNENSQNILHMACNNVSIEILKFILEFEIIDPQIEDNCKENLIHYAARNGICDIFDFTCVKNLPKDVFNRKNNFHSINLMRWNFKFTIFIKLLLILLFYSNILILLRY